jgi:hypothetical protein
MRPPTLQSKLSTLLHYYDSEKDLSAKMTPKGEGHFTIYFTTYFTTRKTPVSASIERKKGAKNDTHKKKPRDRCIP